MTDFATLEHDLTTALVRRSDRGRRRRRRLATTAAVALAASALSAAAMASGIGDDLALDPTEWSILGAGSVDGGRGEYVHAQRRADGSRSTFLLERDAGLPAYQAFRLHEETLDAANATSPGAVRVEPGTLCTPAELTRAETVALRILRAQFPAGTAANATKTAVDTAVRNEFAADACRGLEYAGEQARLVYAGTMPASKLMPGVE
jgi:hypothetical protein